MDNPKDLPSQIFDVRVVKMFLSWIMYLTSTYVYDASGISSSSKFSVSWYCGQKLGVSRREKWDVRTIFRK